MPPAAPASPAAAPKPTIECFKVGRHTAMSGAALSFAQSDLAATAGAYDPALHEAPLVKGHPKLDGPALGWVGGLALVRGSLEALPRKVDPAFAAEVQAGAYGKVSAAFFAPDSPLNPVPGVYYLRHIGFLGATPPAVKGLRDPSAAVTDPAAAYAELEPGVVVFSEWDDVDNAALWRTLRDWVLGKFGLADADSAVPSYLVGSLERGAQAELASAAATAIAEATPAPAFAQVHPQTETTTVTEAEKIALEAENASLRQQNASLHQQNADSATAQRKARLDGAHGEAVAFADSLKAQTTSDDRELVVTVFDIVATQAEAAGAALEFGEGEAKAALLPALKALLAQLPPRVAAGRVATHGRAAEGAAGPEFAAPAGVAVDPARLALRQRALDHMAAHPGCDFITAARAVGA